jgi:hypothetical protein
MIIAAAAVIGAAGVRTFVTGTPPTYVVALPPRSRTVTVVV